MNTQHILYGGIVALVLTSAAVRAFPLSGITSLTGASTVVTPAEASEGNTVKPIDVQVEVDAASLDVNGNGRRYRQYVTPPDGVYPGLVHLRLLQAGGVNLAEANIHDLGQTSVQSDLWLSTLSGLVAVKGRQRHSEFYRDFIDETEPFKRGDAAADAAIAVWPGQLCFAYDGVRLRQSGDDAEEDWERQDIGAGYTTRLGGWLAGIGADRDNFTFFTGSQYSGDTETASLRFATPRSDRLSLEATGALMRTSFDLTDLEQNANRITVHGVYQLGRDFALIGEGRRYEITDTITRNAYAKRELGGEAGIEYYGLANTTLEVGAGQRQVDYINSPQTLEIPTEVFQYYTSATSRLNKHLKVRLHYRHAQTRNEPVEYDVVGVPYDTLFWSRRNDMSAEVTLTPTWRTGLTARFQRAALDNYSVGSGSAISQGSLSGWWMPSDRLTLYGTYLHQQYDLHGVSEELPAATSDDEVFTFGAGVRASKRLSVDTAITNADVRGRNLSDQWDAWVGMNYLLSHGARLSLRATLGEFDTVDYTPLLNNDHTWIQLGITNLVF